MKTAMIQLRDRLLLEAQNLNKYHSRAYLRGYCEALENVAKDIEAQMLAEEKEQILQAFVAGDERGTNDIPFNAEQYYSQNYLKN
jgi:hypothetical protein